MQWPPLQAGQSKPRRTHKYAPELADLRINADLQKGGKEGKEGMQWRVGW